MPALVRQDESATAGTEHPSAQPASGNGSGGVLRRRDPPRPVKAIRCRPSAGDGARGGSVTQGR